MQLCMRRNVISERERTMENKPINFKDLVDSMKQLPRTLKILKEVNKKLYRLNILFSIISGIFPIVTLLLSKELINSLSDHNPVFKKVCILFCIYILVSMVSNLVSEVNEYIQTLYQYELQYNLQYMIIGQCTRLELRDFEMAETYDTIEKVTTEVSYRPYQTFLSIISIVTGIVTMLSAIGIILAWKPIMAVLLLLIPILSMYYYLKIGKQEFDMMWNRAKEERKMWYLNYVLTHDFSYKEIRVLEIGDYILSKYKNICQSFMKENTRLLNKKTKFDVVYEIVVQAISFVVIGFSVVSTFVGNLLVGNVLAIINSVGMIQSNSRSVMVGIYALYSNSLYMTKVFDFLEKNESQENEKNYTKMDALEKIELKDVAFSYDGTRDVLQDVSLTFEKGKNVAIVGANGSGKSTMLKLLTGMYRPSRGEIYYNGIKSDAVELKELYQKISVLFQDYVKYELSLRENVGFGNIESINQDEKIKEVLDKLKLDFLKDEKGDYNLEQQLGNWFENGRDLSQGQWQKVALARVLLKDAECYILDEPNAALDTISEKEIFDTFFNVSKNKIYIYISHRLSSAKLADTIIVMDQGRVVATGTHEELMKHSPEYIRLYEAEEYEVNDKDEHEARAMY